MEECCRQDMPRREQRGTWARRLGRGQQWLGHGQHLRISVFQLRSEGPERACDSRQVHRAKQGPVLGVQAQGGMGTKSHKLGMSANCPFVVPGPHPSTR